MWPKVYQKSNRLREGNNDVQTSAGTYNIWEAAGRPFDDLLDLDPFEMYRNPRNLVSGLTDNYAILITSTSSEFNGGSQLERYDGAIFSKDFEQKL